MLIDIIDVFVFSRKHKMQQYQYVARLENLQSDRLLGFILVVASLAFIW